MKTAGEYICEAIWTLKPNSEFSFVDDDYSSIKWDVLEGIAPTKTEIDAAIAQIKEREAQTATETAAKRQEVLDKIGLTEEEAKLLLS